MVFTSVSGSRESSDAISLRCVLVPANESPPVVLQVGRLCPQSLSVPWPVVCIASQATCCRVELIPSLTLSFVNAPSSLHS